MGKLNLTKDTLASMNIVGGTKYRTVETTVGCTSDKCSMVDNTVDKGTTVGDSAAPGTSRGCWTASYADTSASFTTESKGGK